MTTGDIDGRGRARLSRRMMLTGTIALGAAATTGGVLLPRSTAYADAYTDLRDRWVDILTGRSDIDPALPEFERALASSDNKVDSDLSRLDRTSGRTRVFTDLELDQTTDSALVTATFSRLRGMAIAWATPGSAHYQSADLLTDLLAGLATANTVVYRDGGPRFGNWWDWEIGSSKWLADILVLLDTQLPATVRERYAAAIRYHVPDPWYMHAGQSNQLLSTGANRVDMCYAALVEGVASRSSSRIARAAAGLPPTCAYVNNGDGFWADGSFIQHNNVPYTGAYGTVLLSGLASLVTLLAGSNWALTDPAMQNLYGAVELAFAPVIHDGRMMSFVRGRGIARATETEHTVASTAIVAILQLARAGVVDEATARRWRGRCRGWLERAQANGGHNPYSVGVAGVGLISQLLRGEVAALPEPDESVVFRNMARAVHRRNGWAFAISMTSNRIARYEMTGPGQENLHGFHTGAGMTYLYDDDNTQYTDDFWPTVDPYLLPGTTIDTTELADGAGRELSTARWAGGAVLDGRYSAVGMTVTAAATNLVGKKSWFCFDEFIVCMGRSIKGGGGREVRTIVENRNLHESGTNRLIVNGAEWTGSQETFTDPQWAHIEGVGGYVFVRGGVPALTVLRETRTGRWRDIRINGGTAPINRRYLTLILNHGRNPTDGKYIYLVVPKATPERTAYLFDHRDVKILGTDYYCHAVHQSGTGITMVNFWHSPHTVGGITVDEVCSVIVRERDDKLTVALARPLRDGVRVRCTIAPAQTGYQLVRKDSAVTVVSTGTSIVLDVKTGLYGKPFTAEFARAG